MSYVYSVKRESGNSPVDVHDFAQLEEALKFAKLSQVAQKDSTWYPMRIPSIFHLTQNWCVLAAWEQGGEYRVVRIERVFKFNI